MSKTIKPQKMTGARAQRLREERQQRLTLILVIGSVAVIVALVLILPQILATRAPEQSTILTPVARDYPKANGMAMGDPNAPVKVEEFSDFECSHCKDFSEKVEPIIIQNYIATGKVYFKFTPFSFLGQGSIDAAQAAYCASDQGKFWPYKDVLFLNMDPTNPVTYNRASLVAYAQKIGLNTSKFGSCIDKATHAAKVQNDLRAGKTIGVTGTPSFVINNKVYFQDTLVDAINKALAGGQ